MSDSGDSTTHPALTTHGHFGRSPAHWDRARSQAPPGPESARQLPWRLSVDDVRPSCDDDSYAGIRRCLSRTAQSLPPAPAQDSIPARFPDLSRHPSSKVSSEYRHEEIGEATSAGSSRGSIRHSSLSRALSSLSATPSLPQHQSSMASADLQEPLLLSESSRREPSTSDAAPNVDIEAALLSRHHQQQCGCHSHASCGQGMGHGSLSQSAKISSRQQLTIDGITGIINTIVSLPVMLSFAVIIFKDEFFAPYTGSLVRLVLLSASIHQAAFTALSTIPFAVGQVQDVGLIFCSSIASSVVAYCKGLGVTDHQVLSTVLLTLTFSTLTAGIAIVAIGKLRLASTVQYVPLSVIGGYLGYVGLFVGISGAGLATGRTFDGLPSLLHWASLEAIQKLAPAVAGAALLWVITHRLQSPWALPAALVAMPAVFFGVLLVCDISIADARSAGWFQHRVVAAPQHFWDVWRLFEFGKLFAGTDAGGVVWGAMPRQAVTVAALASVVAFGSSLDVAAIQQDNSEELDFNREMITVGCSNIAAGLSGAGYTGSYIFSQTIFSMRAKVKSRACGAVIVIGEFACFAAPFNIVEYLPLFFLGALMLWIGYEIIQDWLLSSKQRMTSVEYVLLLLTFVAITALGLELGIALGILLAALFFVFQYARVNMTAFSVVPSRSGFVRTFQQRTTLEALTHRVIAVSLSGYIFFGSAVKISNNVCQIVRSRVSTDDGTARDSTSKQPARCVADACTQSSKHRQQHMSSGCSSAMKTPRFCLLDFRRVSGIDGTASRQFCVLRQRLERIGIELVITHLPPNRPEIEQLLFANGVIAAPSSELLPGMCRAFTTLDQGLYYCEEALLKRAVQSGVCHKPAATVNLSEVLSAHLAYPVPLLPGTELSCEQAAAEMQRYILPRGLENGQELFRVGDAPDEMYIIHSGNILCRMHPSQPSDIVASSPIARSGGHANLALHEQTDVYRDSSPHHSLFKYGPGAIIGELDFFLQRPRSFVAMADGPGRLFVIPRLQFERMAREAPALTTLLQAAMLRCTCLSAAHALEALETNSSI